MNIGRPIELDYNDNDLRAKSYFGSGFNPEQVWQSQNQGAAPKRKKYNPATGRIE
jgi:hypothetical protein